MVGGLYLGCATQNGTGAPGVVAGPRAPACVVHFAKEIPAMIHSAEREGGRGSRMRMLLRVNAVFVFHRQRLLC